MRNFAQLLDAADLSRAQAIPVAVIGQQTARAARELGFTVAVEPPTATLEAMVAAIVNYFLGQQGQPATSPPPPAPEV